MILTSLLAGMALAADPLTLEAKVCEANIELVGKRDYWKRVFDGFEFQRRQNIPNVEEGIRLSKKSRAEELESLEKALQRRLGEYRKATGKDYDLARCETATAYDNRMRISEMPEEPGFRGLPKLVSPAEAKNMACGLYRAIEARKQGPSFEGIVIKPELRKKLAEADENQKKAFAEIMEGYERRFGNKLDLATCPRETEEAEGPPPPPPREVPPTPTETAIPTIVTAPPPRRPPLDPWRLSVKVGDLPATSVFPPSPDGTKECGKLLRSAQSHREVHFADESFHQVCRLKTERPDTIAFRFRVRSDRSVRGAPAFREDFVCELFQEIGGCWRSLRWSSFPMAPPCKNLVYDANEPRYQGPTALKAGHCLIKAWMDQKEVFDAKEKNAREGRP